MEGQVVLVGATFSVEQRSASGNVASSTMAIKAEDLVVGEDAIAGFDFSIKTPIENGTTVNMLDGDKGVVYAWDDGEVVVDYNRKPLRGKQPQGIFGMGNGWLLLLVNFLLLVAAGIYFGLFRIKPAK